MFLPSVLGTVGSSCAPKLPSCESAVNSYVQASTMPLERLGPPGFCCHWQSHCPPTLRSFCCIYCSRHLAPFGQFSVVSHYISLYLRFPQLIRHHHTHVKPNCGFDVIIFPRGSHVSGNPVYAVRRLKGGGYPPPPPVPDLGVSESCLQPGQGSAFATSYSSRFTYFIYT